MAEVGRTARRVNEVALSPIQAGATARRPTRKETGMRPDGSNEPMQEERGARTAMARPGAYRDPEAAMAGRIRPGVARERVFPSISAAW
jgi:hypothetical protein